MAVPGHRHHQNHYPPRLWSERAPVVSAEEELWPRLVAVRRHHYPIPPAAFSVQAWGVQAWREGPPLVAEGQQESVQLSSVVTEQERRRRNLVLLLAPAREVAV